MTQTTQAERTVEQAADDLIDEWGHEPTIRLRGDSINVATNTAEDIASWDGLDGFEVDFSGKSTVVFARVREDEPTYDRST